MYTTLLQSVHSIMKDVMYTHPLCDSRVVIVNRLPRAEKDVCGVEILHTTTKSLTQQVQNVRPCSAESSVDSLVHLDEEDGSAVLGDVDVAPEPGN